MIERSLTVSVRDGLHARPATQFVKLAKSFGSDIQIRCNGRSASAKSAVKLMLLGVKENDEATLIVEGEDAADAMAALSTFLQTPTAGEIDLAGRPAGDAGDRDAQAEGAARFETRGEDGHAPNGAGIRGIAASEGTAFGPAFAFFPQPLRIETARIATEEVEAEIARYRSGLAQTTDAFRVNKGRAGVTGADAAIIEALIEVAEDDDFTSGVEDAIRSGLEAKAAVRAVGNDLAAKFEAMDDPYIRARAEDIRSVTRQVLLTLLGRTDVTLADLPAGSIVVADEITAWDLAKGQLSGIAGIVCRKGAATSHIAIMARAHMIPAVLGLKVPEETLRGAATIALDGGAGRVILDPSASETETVRAAIAREAEERAALDAYRDTEPHTKDGRRIEVAANLGSLAEVEGALEAGAMGVGLFRTEFLFMERRTLPSEDEQAEVYTRLAHAFAPHPVVIRTLDIGGDKPIAGVEFEHEDNPFLGWRGVRMCLERTDIFKPQLRALLRASVVGNLKILLPMIADAGEVAAVRRLIEDCRKELSDVGVKTAAFELGVMIETPSAVFLADELARAVDFFSIGTNDLTQYVMAADRLNPKVASLNRTEHPAVKAAIAMATKAAREAGIWVGVCGEAAARPDLIPFFLENGVSELSMSAASIARAKKRVTECRADAA